LLIPDNRTETENHELVIPTLEQKDKIHAYRNSKDKTTKDETKNNSEKPINSTLLLISVIFSYLELISDEEYAQMATLGSA
jgi:hypothetical protein